MDRIGISLRADGKTVCGGDPVSKQKKKKAIPEPAENLRLNPEARIASAFDSVSVKKFRVPEAERTGFRVLDNCAEEHQQ